MKRHDLIIESEANSSVSAEVSEPHREGEGTGKSLLNIKRRLMKFLLLYIFNLPFLIDQSAIRPSEATRGPGARTSRRVPLQ